MYDLIKFLERQHSWSKTTFGPGDRTTGIVAHIRKELDEIESAPMTMILEEFIDVVILAFDAMWRLGYSPDQITTALEFKYLKNMNRKWPDWQTIDPDIPIEHIRE
jgi:hypothetical protein